MGFRSTFVIGTASLCVLSAVVAGACVGDDPEPGTTPGDGGTGPDGTSPTSDGGGNDSASGTFTVTPANIDLAPDTSVSVKISGGTPGTTVTLALGGEEIPDGGPAAKGVSVAASSLTFAVNGEANVEIKASADATQQRFKLTIAGGASPQVIPGRVTGKPGTLDLFFGDQGGWFEFANTDTQDTTANSVIVQPDGKFIVGGTGKNYSQVLIARFTADGALDTTFATTGYMFIPGARSPEMALFSDGSIIIAAASPNNPKLWRVDTGGNYVAGWGNSAGIDPGLTGGALDPGFSVVKDSAYVSGRPLFGVADAGVAIIKYNSDAGRDPAWGDAGMATFNVGFGTYYSSDTPVALVADSSNGDLWACGQYYPGSNPEKSWVRRLNASGQLQINPVVNDTTAGAASRMVLQDFKPVVAASEYGGASDGLYVFRVNGAGLDSTFGTAGKTKLSSQMTAGAGSIALDSDKRIYVPNSGGTVVEVYRLTASGMLDTTFGDNGKFSMAGRAYGVAVTGRQLLVVGVDDGSNQRRARIARLWL